MTTAESPPPADAEHHTTYLDLVDPETGFTVEMTSSHPKPIDTWLADVDFDSLRLQQSDALDGTIVRSIVLGQLYARAYPVLRAFLLAEIQTGPTGSEEAVQSWTLHALDDDEEEEIAAYHFKTRAVGYKPTSAIHGREEGSGVAGYASQVRSQESESARSAQTEDQGSITKDSFLALLQVHERELEARREDMKTLHMMMHTMLKAVLPAPKSAPVEGPTPPTNVSRRSDA